MTGDADALEDPRHYLQRFAEYGRAWRADNSLTFNAFERQSNKSRNTFKDVVDRLEETHKKLFMPRIALQSHSQRHSRTIISEWSEKDEIEASGRETKRTPGLTHYGNAVTDYFIIRSACDAMMKLVLEQRELPPAQVVSIFGARSFAIGGDSPSRRRSIGEGCAEFLAERAIDFAIVGNALKKKPDSPGSILEKHAEAMAYVPMSPEELAAYYNDADQSTEDRLDTL